MLILEALPKSPAWQTVSIGPDVSLEVQITRPSYADFIAERAAVNAAEAARLRLNCITNWRGVFEESADGQKTELPFSRDALGGAFPAVRPGFRAAARRCAVSVRTPRRWP